MSDHGVSTTLPALPIHRVSPRGVLAELVARRRQELFAAQAWRPGCARCGQQAGLMDGERARAWFAEHRCEEA